MRPFKVGDWAKHKTGTLDPRKVVKVQGGIIWIDCIGTPLAVLAEQYNNLGPKERV